MGRILMKSTVLEFATDVCPFQMRFLDFYNSHANGLIYNQIFEGHKTISGFGEI